MLGPSLKHACAVYVHVSPIGTKYDFFFPEFADVIKHDANLSIEASIVVGAKSQASLLSDKTMAMPLTLKPWQVILRSKLICLSEPLRAIYTGLDYS